MNAQSPNFDSIKHVNPYGVEYWSARDLAPLLGYEKWQRFTDALKRAMTACEQVGQSVQDHFTASGKMVRVGSGAEREVKDYFLSRFACYLVAQNGDPRKLEIAEAQAYFAVATRANELHQLREEQEKRLELRERVAKGNVKLAEAAKNAGVRSKNFGTFQNAGYIGMYTLDVSGIRERKGIPAGAEILDHMGRRELAANEFRITQTEGKLIEDEIVGEDRAIDTHYRVGKEVRSAIQRIGGQLPEDIAPEPSIKALLAEKRRARKKLVKPQPKPDEPEQSNLFNDV